LLGMKTPEVRQHGAAAVAAMCPVVLKEGS
jgi:hypothetical protein